jgi:hypothetical protein
MLSKKQVSAVAIIRSHDTGVVSVVIFNSPYHFQEGLNLCVFCVYKVTIQCFLVSGAPLSVATSHARFRYVFEGM